jgi:hypothetical protein
VDFDLFFRFLFFPCGRPKCLHAKIDFRVQVRHPHKKKSGFSQAPLSRRVEAPHVKIDSTRTEKSFM